MILGVEELKRKAVFCRKRTEMWALEPKPGKIFVREVGPIRRKNIFRSTLESLACVDHRYYDN
jgi:hypothetical protein